MRAPALHATSSRIAELRFEVARVDGHDGGVAQTVRAGGSYPPCRGFESLHRHQISPAFSRWDHSCTLAAFAPYEHEGV